MESGEASQKTRGMSRQVPVAAMMFTPEPRETSSSIRMSRPRSIVVTSMMVWTPSARAAARSLMPPLNDCVAGDELRVDLLDAGGGYEDVLVGEGEAHVCGVEGAEDGVYLCHGIAG